MSRKVKTNEAAAMATMTIQPAPAAAPEPIAPWRRQLTETQERVCELASDMILNGSDAKSIEMFLSGLVRHDRKRRYPDLHGRDEAAVTDTVSCWTKALIRNWPNKKPDVERPEPTTVTEMVCSNVRGELEQHFQDFMTTVGDLAEVYLLRDVLRDWYTQHNELGEAFSYQIDASHTYVKVSWKRHKQLRAFARALDMGEMDADED